MECINLNFTSSSPSGRELFLADASLFVDDAEAYDKYQREDEPEAEQKVAAPHFTFSFLF